MDIYNFTFLATPTPDAKEFDTSGGAYVDCWIQSGDRDQAEERATALIYDYGWSVESLEDEAVVTIADYTEDAENRQFFEQALSEGEVLVFHTWPPGEGEEP
jgi:hypothetical protein